MQNGEILQKDRTEQSLSAPPKALANNDLETQRDPYARGRAAASPGESSAPIRVGLPDHLRHLPLDAFLEMRLVWDKAGRHYQWHLVIEDGTTPAAAPGNHVAGIDLGEVHPAAASDGSESMIFSARQLRSLAQYSNKRLSELQQKQSKKVKGSRRWKRIQRRKNRFLAQQRRRKRDIEHKVSRAVVDWATDRQVGKLAVGDVRDIADGVDLGKQTNQKIANWTHGKLRNLYRVQSSGRWNRGRIGG